MKYVNLTCPGCGAPAAKDKNGDYLKICPYCGRALILDDGSVNININKTIKDEARLKEAELKERQLEHKMALDAELQKSRKLWKKCVLAWVAAIVIALLLSDLVDALKIEALTSALMAVAGGIMLFGGIALALTHPNDKRIRENEAKSRTEGNMSDKSRIVALVLCICLGIFGAHHFYAGKTGMGILYLVTFGLIGVGWLVDIGLILIGVYKDANGRIIYHY